jgi:glyceraldehyde-3-phosphate dehydrogenase (ferredoxin)
MISIIGTAPVPSMLYLNRIHGEEIEVEIMPLNLEKAWQEGRGGVYGLLDYILSKYIERYKTDPRILAEDPAALSTDFGAIGTAPIKNGKISFVDTWAGRGGFGSKLSREHGIAAIIYGGAFIDEDFRDNKVADQWFKDKYQKKMSANILKAVDNAKIHQENVKKNRALPRLNWMLLLITILLSWRKWARPSNTSMKVY